MNRLTVLFLSLSSYIPVYTIPVPSSDIPLSRFDPPRGKTNTIIYNDSKLSISKDATFTLDGTDVDSTTFMESTVQITEIKIKNGVVTHLSGVSKGRP